MLKKVLTLSAPLAIVAYTVPGVPVVMFVGLGVFGLAFAFSPLFEVNASSGHRYNLTFLVGAAAPFFFLTLDLTVAALAAGFLGVQIARIVALVDGGEVSADLRRFLGATIYSVIILGSDLLSVYLSNGLLAIAIFSGAGFIWMAFDAVWRGLGRSTSVKYELRYSLGDAPLFFSLLSAGAVVGVVWLATDTWWVAMTVGAIPFFMTFSSFRRFDVARSTYEQTILALAKIPEIAGLSFSGHAERTAELAVGMGIRLEMGPSDLRNLKYAALMHDIGRITLNEPSIVERGYTSGDLTGWSAEIIAEAEYLKLAADVVRVHHRPYRSPGEKADESVPLAARIVRVAAEFDRLVREDEASPLEALESLHRSVAYDFDPEVVAALRSTLEESRGLSVR